MISRNLKEVSIVKCAKGKKIPIEANWQKGRAYSYDEAHKLLEQGYNIGLRCGAGIVGIDCDSQKAEDIAKTVLPQDTYIQLSAIRKKSHYFFKCQGWKINKSFSNPKNPKEHYGEIRSQGLQIILAPSQIDGKKYTIKNDAPIKEIDSDVLLRFIEEMEKDQIELSILKEVKSYSDDVNNIPILEVMDTSGFKRSLNGELYGSNQWHGSSTGMNTWVNESKNVGYCFRCGEAITPIKAIALNEGIIRSCKEPLRGQKFLQAKEIAYNKGFLKREIVPVVSNGLPVVLEVRDYRYFERLKKNKNYIVQDIIQPGTLVMIYSPPAQFKSLIILQLCLSVATGKPFLGFKTKKCAILISDQENSEQIIRERLIELRKGLKIRKKDFPLFYLNRGIVDLFNKQYMEELKRIIIEKDIKLLVLDTLHRHANYDENSANDINELYMKIFSPLIEELGVAIVFLHHTDKKGKGYRGSVDLLGMTDMVYKIMRHGKSNRFSIVNEKNRMGEIEQINGEVLFKDKEIVIDTMDNEEIKTKAVSKIIDLTAKIKKYFEDGQTLKKADVKFRLDQEEYQYSDATLKRVLSWLVEKNHLQQPKKGWYCLMELEEKVE